MQTLNVENTRFETKINGETIIVDFAKMHPTWIEAHLQKAAQRFLNDKHSGEKGDVKLELIRAELKDVHSGEPMPQKERKSPVAKADPARKMARDMATTFLVSAFKSKFGGDSAHWATEPKIAHLFRTTEAGNVRFDLAAVDKWIDGYADKRNFMQEARDAIASAQESVDLDDLGL